MQVRQYGLTPKEAPGHRAIASLLVRADRGLTYLEQLGASFPVVLTQSALASQTKLALALDKSTAALGPGLPAVRKIPSHVIRIQAFTHSKKPGEYSVPEEQGTRSLYIRTLDSSHLVVQRKKEEAER